MPITKLYICDTVDFIFLKKSILKNNSLLGLKIYEILNSMLFYLFYSYDIEYRLWNQYNFTYIYIIIIVRVALDLVNKIICC